MGHRTCTLALIALGLSGWSSTAFGTTSYYVRLRPAGGAGLRAVVAFDMTHADPLSSNTLRLLDFNHDGTRVAATVEGGPAEGDLFSATNPASLTTLDGQFFYNSLSIPFDALGTTITTRIELTEEAPASSFAPDEAAGYLLNRSTGLPYPTADGLGTNALFAIDVSGIAGGELSVFSPMTFIPPDTLALDSDVVSVPVTGLATGRLRVRSAGPNPSAQTIRLVCDVPPPGGALKVSVFDVSGRLVAEKAYGLCAPGSMAIDWDGSDQRKRRAAAGIYLIQVQLGDQSVIRRVVLSK